MKKSFALLDVPETTPDDVVINIFEIRIQDDPSKIDQYRQALAAIGKARSSYIIQTFLTTGEFISDC